MAIQRLMMLVNPRGGTRRGLAVFERVQPTFAAAGIELDVRVTERPGHAREIARSLDLSGFDGVCAIGGDGTIHEIADGLMQRDEVNSIPLGIIAAGTGNTLAQHLGCDDPLEAARRIVSGATQPLDVVRVTLNDEIIYCVDIIGWGAVSDINANAERLRWLGPSRYGAAALWQILRAKRRRATLMLDSRAIDDEFLFVIACNPKYTGSNMMLAPHADLSDGLLDVVVVRRATRWQMLKLFSKVFDGSHVELDYVEYHRVRSFAITSPNRDQLNLDGEMRGHTPISAEVLPSALRIFHSTHNDQEAQ